MVSSISDTNRYRSLCEMAASDGNIFNSFRQNPEYQRIVETLDPISAVEYINIALSSNPNLIGIIDELRRNDEVGGPLTYEYSIIGRFSPTTLRYIKIATDLNRMFGSLNGYRIAEIGAGYGGQCRILHVHDTPSRYNIFDLREPLHLTKRFLENFGINSVGYYDVMNYQSEDYDLVISNYAFSEIGKDVQDIYLDLVISKSRHGYMIYNQSAFSDDFPGFSYTAEEVVAMIPNASITSTLPYVADFDSKHGCILIHW